VNPGLNPICPNITGGNLHAQGMWPDSYPIKQAIHDGSNPRTACHLSHFERLLQIIVITDEIYIILGYWIPYEAAKALAAKFCYKIRFALTPIFGEDFPGICLPEDHEDFGKYNIDPVIVAKCQQRTADQKRFEIERSRCEAAAATLISSTSRYATPAESTPRRSSFQIASPQMGSMSGRFFDPVRDDYTTVTDSQPSDFSSPNGLWPSSGPVTPTASTHYEGQMLSGTPSKSSYYRRQYIAPENTMPQRAPRGPSNRHHPYPEYFVAGDIPTAARSPGGLGGRSPQLMLGSPAESIMSCEPSHVPRLSPYSYLPPMHLMRPEYPPIYPSIQGPIQEHNTECYFPSPAALLQRCEPPNSRHEADLEHDSKRRRASDQLSSPSMDFFERLLREDGEYTARNHRDSTIPMTIDSYTRSPPPQPILSVPFPMNTDAEKDVAEAAVGLMNLRRKDTELELENTRRYSA
jgi:hypothetical protein